MILVDQRFKNLLSHFIGVTRAQYHYPSRDVAFAQQRVAQIGHHLVGAYYGHEVLGDVVTRFAALPALLAAVNPVYKRGCEQAGE